MHVVTFHFFGAKNCEFFNTTAADKGESKPFKKSVLSSYLTYLHYNGSLFGLHSALCLVGRPFTLQTHSQMLTDDGRTNLQIDGEAYLLVNCKLFFKPQKFTIY